MNVRRRVLIGSASAVAIICAAAPTFAAEAASNGAAVDEIVVTGIRESLQKAIQVKKNSDEHVDAISATDIGKLPDKNVADALQRIPGVNIASSAGGEGGFDEADRVSIRGTSPSLTQVTIDGHSVATGDWFILDQYETVGRSTSFELLPAETVAGATVYKTQNASLLEGGVSGSVDVITRKPLDFKQQFTAEASVQGAYDSLAGSTKPQINGLLGWKNQDSTFGVLLQGFYEDRTVQRNGQETLGYTKLLASQPTVQANPSLLGVMAPTLIGSSLFQQEKKRSGIDGSVQWEPNDKFEVRLSGFYSKLNATNNNYNYMYWGTNEYNNNAPSSFTVANNTLTSAAFPALNAGGNPVDGIIVDAITRPSSGSSTYYVNLDGKYKVNDKLTFTGQIGYSEGTGDTPNQLSYEVDGAPGISYAPSGNGWAVTPSNNPQSPAGLVNDWAWTAILRSADKEAYGQVDGDWAVGNGVFKDVLFGVRASDHTRQVDFWDRGCTLGANGSCFGAGTQPYSTVNPVSYPSNYSGGELGIPGLIVPLHGSPSAVDNVVNSIPGGVRGSAKVVEQAQNWYWPDTFKVHERDTEGYVMAKVGGEGWRGNFGVRIAGTQETADVNISDPVIGGVSGTLAAANGTKDYAPASAYGPFFIDKVTHNYIDILPSVNFTFDLQKNLLLRLSAAETMSRPDYSDLGGGVALTNLTLTGNKGNPDLKPVKAAVYDASLEWYYQPTSLLAASVFYNDFSSYVSYLTTTGTYFDQQTNSNQLYTLNTPTNIGAELKGVELQLQQPLPYNFGFQTNLTVIDSEAATGGPMIGTSKITYNLVGYYEQKWGSARLAYTYRSSYFIGFDRGTPEHEEGYGQLDASVNINVTPNISLTFDAKNITDTLIKYYAANTTQPRAVYDNGSQYYFGIKAKF
ncbi:MAG TPA: TonB-dependent receptor [Caulobacteraceae bacterium]|jgi:iron complex outermembrane receptor protein